MNTPYGYNSPRIIKHYSCLRTATIWAGIFGVAEALIWMGLTLTGIFAYTCYIPGTTVTFGSLIQVTFLNVYFKGNCYPEGWQDFNTDILDGVKPILDPTQILIWDCVYLGVAVCWLLASILLLTHVRKDDIKMTLGMVFSWVFITFCICAMDLALGIIFGIDYGLYHFKGYNYNLSSINAGELNPNASFLVAAGVAAVSLMIISLKGFILWIVNFSLMVYLLLKAICISNDKGQNDNLFMPRTETGDILTTRPPINAYGEEKSTTNAYNNAAYVPDNQSAITIELNQDSIIRAARMSTDVSLHDGRFRNIESYSQYPPPRYNKAEQIKEVSVEVSAFPAPDYSPPSSRANQNQNSTGLLRNQRYQ